MVAAGIRLGHQCNVVQTRAVVHAAQCAAAVDLNHRLDRHQVRAGVSVFKAYWHPAQQFKAARVQQAHLLDDGQAVHQRGEATRGVVLQAVQQLNARDRRAVGVVGVRPQSDWPVGQVVRVWA